ncbi:N-acetylglucosamine kinase [Arthrobacter russicus]|uniref:N-acetylglucosamine kinase-like BadF-type ATPase n=1 Tax=Arthrobacter russicus TaxID=172040 RepID=A0ABU1JCS3_9MICC|nr:BadF/BadG/BcrA/BcrD ATPase family protein [Arthrobacter russicus]MDR6269686.1 N-acetylglucosamine kinase-like BadF-type ATPase [Arthrobacter russicus]
MALFLAVDAGGTSTRAAVLDQFGNCLGFGKAGPGNPISSGVERATESVSEASRQALGELSEPRPELQGAALAMAGGSVEVPLDGIQSTLRAHGLQNKAMIESDLLAMYLSGTHHSDGFALVSGTGAICARVEQFETSHVADGLGWLLGDQGSGYWIGHEAVLAVAAALDGRAPRTMLTGALLEQLAVPRSALRIEGRPAELQSFLLKIYALRPIQLAGFATLAFDAAEQGDQVAAEILRRAGRALLHSLAAVRPEGTALPLVIGGSILRAGSPVLQTVQEALPGVAVTRVEDGLAGAASIVLRRAGITVDEAVFTRIRDSLGGLRNR